MFLGSRSFARCRLPDVSQLQERVTRRIEGNDQKHLTRQLQKRNLEQALSRIRRLADLVEDSELEGLSRETARRLDQKVCQSIISELAIENADLSPVLMFASWAARVDYRWPLEVFTVN